MEKIKCVLVGTGSRGVNSYVVPIVKGHLSEHVSLLGVTDAVLSRAELLSRSHGGIPVYDDFDRMLDETHPDYVIVTTSDDCHHDYIIKALERGYDVISEKPMTNTRKKALAIMEAERRTGHRVKVTFNMRYMPPIMDLKEVLASGVIGDIRQVDFTWQLDRSHGADYFRRWHRLAEKSNSLLLHKSTHHFDVINWVIGKKPLSVFAKGSLEFYGKNGPYRGASCHACEHTALCPFYMDVAKDPFLKAYYLDLEHDSGYCRDGCVFAEEIDIYDKMSLLVSYEGGTTMNYSLTCYAPDEGYHMRFIGTEGRVEFTCYTSGPRKKDPLLIRIVTANGEERVVETSFGKGDHGGGDDAIRRDLFGLSDPESDPLGRAADSYAGYLSLSIGDMAVESVKSGREVAIDQLLF